MHNLSFNSIFVFLRSQFVRQGFILLLTLVSCLQVLNPYLLDDENSQTVQTLEIECEQETKSAEKKVDIDYFFSDDQMATIQYSNTEIRVFDFSFPSTTDILENTTPPPELS